MADYSELKRKAQEIKDEVKAGANTANRVGLALEETVKALEAENKRAEQAEESLENAVQLLQDETEDLQSIRDDVERLGSDKADKSALEAPNKEVSKKQNKLDNYKEDPSNGSVEIFAQDKVSVSNDSQGGVSCVEVYNEEDTAEGIIPVARMSADKENGDYASVTVRGNEVHIEGDGVKVNGEDLESFRTTVINNLTTGGADKALSAEMGKELAKEATTEHKGLMSAEDKKKLDKLFPVQSYITNGNIRIDTLEKKIYCEDIRVIDTTAKVIISGSSSLTNIIYDYNSLYSSTLPINLALMVNPETSTSFITNGESDEVLYKIYDGYVIIGYFRTISNTLLCSIDKYSVDDIIVYNTLSEEKIDIVSPKYYSLPILNKTNIPFTQDKIINKNGEIRASSLNVSDFIEAMPGIVLYNLRTPGNVTDYAAIAFYDKAKNCIGYYNGSASSVIPEYIPTISENCRYLRFTTAKGTTPAILFKSDYLTSLEHKIDEISVDAIKRDIISIIEGNKYNISNTPNAIIKISDGTLTISSSYQSSVSDYIGVKGINKICLYNLRTPGSDQYAAIIGYDDNKNIVTSFRSVNTVEDIYEYSIPNGVSYIRFTSNDLATLYSFDIRPKKESIIIIGSSSAQRLEKNDLGNFSLSLLQDSPIYWRGVGGENMQAITARSGITPLFPKANFNIPAAANERVEITGFITDGKDCVFTSQQGNNLPKLNPVVINGVEGNIVYENSKFYFYRFESGKSVEVTESDVISPNDVKYRGAILVAMLGYNGGYTGTEEYVSYHEKARDVFNNSKYLFITRLCDGGWTAITKIKEEENALTARYGTNVLKLRDWISRFGVKFAISLGLLSSETSQDISDRENGYVPTSLRGDGVHLNNIGYQVLSYKINELLRLISK